MASPHPHPLVPRCGRGAGTDMERQLRQTRAPGTERNPDEPAAQLGSPWGKLPAAEPSQPSLRCSRHFRKYCNCWRYPWRDSGNSKQHQASQYHDFTTHGCSPHRRRGQRRGPLLSQAWGKAVSLGHHPGKVRVCSAMPRALIWQQVVPYWVPSYTATPGPCSA